MRNCSILLLEMDRCLLLLLLLLMCRNGFSQGEESCPQTAISSCDDCIKSGPYCVWCKQLNFTKTGAQEAARCDTRSQLMKEGCMEHEIISPKNREEIVKDKPLSASFNEQDPIQLRPQEMKLTLRPGLPTTFPVHFKRVRGYPVDLYYLMDLSYSMKDDLENVKKLGTNLFTALRGITDSGQIGFGAFVDKTVLPFTNTNKEKLLKPCDAKEKHCQAAFGYKHVLSMTSREDKFREEVTKQSISGNLDSPEGSLDAMMQAAVCGDKIGWRNSSTRLLVLTTDAGFHMAGDGKLAGILDPNDEQCHMENLDMKNLVYAKSSDMDYPSVGQLARQLETNLVQPIFAVTKNMETVYTQLQRMIPKSEVGVLSNDSSNVVELIKSAYNKLSEEVTMVHDLLDNDKVTVRFTPICAKGGPPGDKGVCENVGVNDEISFNVTVTANKCLDEMSFTISPQGIQDALRVTISTQCECDCDDGRDRNHAHCNGHGQVSCGLCSCTSGYVGPMCECAVGARDSKSLDALCQKTNGTICEGRGSCVCGTCQCHALESGGSYYGQYCDCDDENCEKDKNALCGGQGDCRCGKCKCKEGYDGPACQCKKSDEQCRFNGVVCSGRGTCKCNQCVCMDGYQRPFCETCPGCPDPCQTKQTCIECRGFDTGPFGKNCSEACEDVQGVLVEAFSLPKKECKMKDTEGCWIKFKIQQLIGVNNFKAEILKTRECPELPNIYAIIGGSIAGVALIGLLILMLLKGLIYMNDLKEFRKFEHEKKRAKWAEADDNPLYKNATTTVPNPMFTGGE